MGDYDDLEETNLASDKSMTTVKRARAGRKQLALVQHNIKLKATWRKQLSAHHAAKAKSARQKT